MNKERLGRTVHVHLERLVVDGGAPGASDQRLWSAAIQAELTRLLRDRPSPGGGGSASTGSDRTFTAASRQVARIVYGRIAE